MWEGRAAHLSHSFGLALLAAIDIAELSASSPTGPAFDRQHSSSSRSPDDHGPKPRRVRRRPQRRVVDGLVDEATIEVTFDSVSTIARRSVTTWIETRVIGPSRSGVPGPGVEGLEQSCDQP